MTIRQQTRSDSNKIIKKVETALEVADYGAFLDWNHLWVAVGSY